MPETIHVYLTVILTFVLGVLTLVSAWLVKTVISSQERIAVLGAVMGDVARQLGEIKAKIDTLDSEMNSGLEKIHNRINVGWRDVRHQEE